MDSGGRFGEFDTWQRVLNATGRPVALENCHAGPLPNTSWCPYTQFRTGGDPDTASAPPFLCISPRIRTASSIPSTHSRFPALCLSENRSCVKQRVAKVVGHDGKSGETSGLRLAVANSHAGGLLLPSFQAGWQKEMASTIPKLKLARRGCWAYPGYAIWNGPGQQFSPDSLPGWRASFGKKSTPRLASRLRGKHCV